ncbi:hypothetical protein ACRRTK_004754 [Alexandromys fortis]
MRVMLAGTRSSEPISEAAVGKSPCEWGIVFQLEGSQLPETQLLGITAGYPKTWTSCLNTDLLSSAGQLQQGWDSGEIRQNNQVLESREHHPIKTIGLGEFYCRCGKHPVYSYEGRLTSYVTGGFRSVKLGRAFSSQRGLSLLDTLLEEILQSGKTRYLQILEENKTNMVSSATALWTRKSHGQLHHSHMEPGTAMVSSIIVTWTRNSHGQLSHSHVDQEQPWCKKYDSQIKIYFFKYPGGTTCPYAEKLRLSVCCLGSSLCDGHPGPCLDPVLEMPGAGVVRCWSCPVLEMPGAGDARCGRCPVREMPGAGDAQCGRCPMSCNSFQISGCWNGTTFQNSKFLWEVEITVGNGSKPDKESLKLSKEGKIHREQSVKEVGSAKWTIRPLLNLCLKVLFRKETHSKSNAIDDKDTSKAVDDVKKESQCKDCVWGSGLSLREKTRFEMWDRETLESERDQLVQVSAAAMSTVLSADRHHRDVHDFCID